MVRNIPPSTHYSMDLLLVHVASWVARIDRLTSASLVIIGRGGCLPTRSRKACIMDRLKTKRAARRTHNPKQLREAGMLINNTNTDINMLTGILDHLSASNLELSSINAALEEHISDDELEAEYSAAAKCNDQAIGMLTESRCQIAALGRLRSQAQAAVSAQTTAHGGS
ncbi:hypothetical protein HPB51_028035 [Rhipicephalus microplus]|uniref:Uncharacterized protein n=1 Tax=Rhipicephalus microplus TaxID=6941 RepID=A0A9J6CYE9_RHIMP|nr:hypothetical protein HPB51_028035 [Rhipicephalus microplus]